MSNSAGKKVQKVVKDAISAANVQKVVEDAIKKLLPKGLVPLSTPTGPPLPKGLVPLSPPTGPPLPKGLEP